MRSAPRAFTPTAAPLAPAPRAEAAQVETWRRAMLMRLALTVAAVAMLLLVWRPAMVQAQGQPMMVPEGFSGGNMPAGMAAKAAASRSAASASLAQQTAGVTDAPPASARTGAPRSGMARPSAPVAAPSAPREAPATEAMPSVRLSENPTTVPYGGVLVTPAGAQVGERDTSRAALRPRTGTALATRTYRGIGLVGGDEQRAARLASEVYTVFHRDLPDPVEAERRTRALLTPNAPADRTGEYEAAPFVVDAPALLRAPVLGNGRITLAQGEPFPRRFRADDQVTVNLPAGSPVGVGTRLVAVVPVGTLGASGRVVSPSGVLEVVRVYRGAATAVVRGQSGTIAEGQALLLARGSATPWQPPQALEAPDLVSAVTWVDGERLASPQGFVLLGAGERQGVRAGDRFALHAKAAPGGAEGEPVAVVRVVRVDATGSTAKITYLQEPALPSALVARRIARSVTGPSGGEP